MKLKRYPFGISRERDAYSRLESHYRPDIDGLRAVAVSSVVFFHAGFFPFDSGFVGVDIFFVISGYLIGGIVLREAIEGHFDFVNFYARRARRILPALILVVLTTCFVGWFLLDVKEYFFVGSTSTSSLLAISNFSFWRLQDYFAPASQLRPLLMTWSLGVEEQFYLLFPLVIIGIVRFVPRRLMTALMIMTSLSLAVALWSAKVHPAAAFYLLPSRAWELGAGVMLVAWQIVQPGEGVRALQYGSVAGRELLASAGALLIVFAIGGFGGTSSFSPLPVVLSVLGTVALISAEKSGFNRRVLSSRPVVFVGLVSYSWYLWHWPLMSYLRIIMPAPPQPWQLAIVTLVSFCLAVLSWHFVERTFRKPTRPPGPTVLRYTVVLGLALVGPIVIKQGVGLAGRLPAQAMEIATQIGTGLDGPCSATWSETKPDLSSDCVVRVPNRPAVALVGDSHAWALGPGLRKLAAQQNVGFRMLTKPGCPPLLGVSVKSEEHPVMTEACAAFMENALREIASDKSVEVVILAALWDNPVDRYVNHSAQHSSKSGVDLLREGLERMVGALRNEKKQIVLVGDSPYWRFDPLRVALAKSIPLRGFVLCSFWPKCIDLFQGIVAFDDTIPADPGSVQVARGVAKTNDVRYVDLFSRFCDIAQCIFQRGNDVLFLDKGHLSSIGADFALDGFNILRDR
jgi:peptidoglycan/LPS O-acetylase OafA/YrhL